ncbi:Nif3-like dinuclear metal center hexameric protein [Chlamydia sp. 17-3921]|uniref:Nif3-like dinuclear metal center hexameric protein n=1 Tax=Chlamydia sp. 17-3921 TaxID=2675798 RepID=UPI00191B1114|nr:Nif3-like dinuclear metal center hexameric protein [Chlamydia sp. 17-3921]
MNISDLLAHLDNLLLTSTFSDYGPNGLQVGNLFTPIEKITVAVTADLETIEKAIQLEANVLIVHHGLFWKGMSYPIIGTLYKRIQRLIQHNIHLLAYHLPLDAHPTLGNNWKTALDLQWGNLQPFGSSFPHLGVQGSFSPLPIEVFIEQLSQYYSEPIKGKALWGPKEVSSAALVSGGAYKELTHAATCKVDCFITGNFDEPAWSIARENHIHFLAFGHTATEKVGPKALAQYLQNQFDLTTTFIDTNNPF